MKPDAEAATPALLRVLLTLKIFLFVFSQIRQADALLRLPASFSFSAISMNITPRLIIFRLAG